jgi:7-cyano-7-deazaguanine synthase
MTSKALVILSGGQDSTTCLYWAREKYGEIHAITFDYGQSHCIEVEAAQHVAALAGVASHEIVRLGRILQSTSPLVSDAPLETYSDFDSMDRQIGSRVELTFVPLRNLLFLTIAANRAVCLGARALVTGICQADNANYPDCREVFACAAEDAIATALGTDRAAYIDQRLMIETPLMKMSKAETVGLAARLPGCLDALALSHTCYAGQRPPCGQCHACVLRAHGFAEAGIEDPLVRASKQTVSA